MQWNILVINQNVFVMRRESFLTLIILFSRYDRDELFIILLLPAVSYFWYQYRRPRIWSTVQRYRWNYWVSSIFLSLTPRWKQISSFLFCSMAASTIRGNIFSMSLSRCIPTRRSRLRTSNRRVRNTRMVCRTTNEVETTTTTTSNWTLSNCNDCWMTIEFTEKYVIFLCQYVILFTCSICNE
jgi:hypothetical protein